MNFKKTAIALAVASVAATPIIASADGSVYASARIGLQYLDGGENRNGDSVNETTDSEITVRSYAARLGFKGETEIGNGWSGWGRYELEVLTDAARDNTSQDATFRRRHAVAGLKSEHNNIYVGQTSHTWYNHIVGPADYPWWGSGYALVKYDIREDNGITYNGSFGVVEFGITGFFQPDNLGGNLSSSGDSEVLDEYQLAISFNIGSSVRLGLGLAGALGDFENTGSPAVAAVPANTTNGDGIPNTAGSEAVDPVPATAVEDEPIIGVSLSIDLGSVNLAGNYQTQSLNGGGDNNSISLNVALYDFNIHYESVDFGNSSTANTALNTSNLNVDQTSLTLGYTLNLGPRTLIWFELQQLDRDTVNDNDDRTIGRATLKYDIL